MSTPSYYVDTSLIIARYKPSDELYKGSNTFFENDFNFVISPITLVELYCVLSRVKNELDIPFQAEPMIDTLVAFMIEDCKLKLLSKSHCAKRDFAGYACRMCLEYYIATKLAGSLGLKTLDMLHLSYAWMLRKSFGINLFVTEDEEILEKAENIRKSLGIKVYNLKQAIGPKRRNL